MQGPTVPRLGGFMKENLAVVALGNRNSGKSTTWYTLFGRTVRTRRGLQPLWLTDTEYVDVFLINGSPQERSIDVAELIGDSEPRIVLCSMQYVWGVNHTFNYFVERD